MHRGKALTTSALALVVVVGLAFRTSEAGADSVIHYDRNSHGLSYGSAANARTPDEEPDLIRVVATNGREGYVTKVSLDEAAGANVNSPAEALAWQESHQGTDDVIPVFESDGTTRIGTFVIHHPSAAERELAARRAATSR